MNERFLLHNQLALAGHTMCIAEVIILDNACWRYANQLCLHNPGQVRIMSAKTDLAAQIRQLIDKNLYPVLLHMAATPILPLLPSLIDHYEQFSIANSAQLSIFEPLLTRQSQNLFDGLQKKLSILQPDVEYLSLMDAEQRLGWKADWLERFKHKMVNVVQALHQTLKLPEPACTWAPQYAHFAQNAYGYELHGAVVGIEVMGTQANELTVRIIENKQMINQHAVSAYFAVTAQVAGERIALINNQSLGRITSQQPAPFRVDQRLIQADVPFELQVYIG